MIKRLQELFDNIKTREKLFLAFIITINLIIKAIPASIIELGNDEVYYWTYALFPEWSHFDHPPLVGVTIQLFTLNLYFDSEFFIRLGALIFSSASIIFLFYLVKKIYSVQAAYISSLLFTASIYFNIISGLFILPDTPQIFFVILALYFGIPAITSDRPSRKDDYRIILFGLFTGFAFLSKYHSLFLWIGFGLYIIINDRRWLKKPSLYLSILTTLIVMMPVIYWNIMNNFISFTFHESRIGLFDSPVDITSFLTFNLGQIFYQNPVLFFAFVITLISLYKKRAGTGKTDFLLLYLSLPLILIFTLFSLFKNTLPHWSGPAFIGLLILTSERLSQKAYHSRRKVWYTLFAANMIVFLILVLAPVQINYGLLYSQKTAGDPKKIGEDDFTMDMYGWRQAGDKFKQFLSNEGIEPKDHDKVRIVSNKWFPAAHLDFYIAHPMKIELLVSGTLKDTHKYYWINQSRRINPGDRIYFITTSQQFFDPNVYKDKYRQIIPKDTLSITRGGKKVKNLFIYEMRDSVLNLP